MHGDCTPTVWAFRGIPWLGARILQVDQSVGPVRVAAWMCGVPVQPQPAPECEVPAGGPNIDVAPDCRVIATVDRVQSYLWKVVWEEVTGDPVTARSSYCEEAST